MGQRFGGASYRFGHHPFTFENIRLQPFAIGYDFLTFQPKYQLAMSSETKTCLECGETIQGRADKKFCDDQCRSLYNNKANSDTTTGMRNINNILRKNRRIMQDLSNEEGKTMLPKSKLADAGFNFKYHTHTYTTQKGSVYKLCYEYGYLNIENDYVMVIRWEKE